MIFVLSAIGPEKMHDVLVRAKEVMEILFSGVRLTMIRCCVKVACYCFGTMACTI